MVGKNNDVVVRYSEGVFLWGLSSELLVHSVDYYQCNNIHPVRVIFENNQAGNVSLGQKQRITAFQVWFVNAL